MSHGESAGAAVRIHAGAVATQELDDVALVQAFRAGDRKAFEALVRRHQRPVWAIANRFAKNRDVADDLAQRTFVLALERINELRGAFRPWLLRIAANLAKNYLRDNAKLISADSDFEPTSISTSDVPLLPDEALDAASRMHAVRLAVALLPDRQREVVLLRIDGQLAFAEIGAALGITENNAKVTFHHAVRRLRESLGGHDAGV